METDGITRVYYYGRPADGSLPKAVLAWPAEGAKSGSLSQEEIARLVPTIDFHLTSVNSVEPHPYYGFCATPKDTRYREEGKSTTWFIVSSLSFDALEGVFVPGVSCFYLPRSDFRLNVNRLEYLVRMIEAVTGRTGWTISVL